MKKSSNSHQKRKLRLITPSLEASRYDEYANYYPHYVCKMDKVYITMVGTLPVFMTHTRGLAGDPQELLKHIEALKKMDARIESYSADGGYDSFDAHADIWYHLYARPVISYASNAVINKEGEDERINHWVIKKWKVGGDVHAPFPISLQRVYILDVLFKGKVHQRCEVSGIMVLGTALSDQCDA